MSPARDKAKLIEIPSDVQLMVGKDGVFLGFFSDSGKVAMVNIEQLAANPNYLPGRSRAALKDWSREQRQRAATSVNVNER